MTGRQFVDELLLDFDRSEPTADTSTEVVIRLRAALSAVLDAVDLVPGAQLSALRSRAGRHFDSPGLGGVR